MPEPHERKLSKHLRRLTLALVNGTAIIVIVAAILAIIASSKVTHLAHSVASATTVAVLSRVDGDPRQIVKNIQRVSDDVHSSVTALERAKVDGVAVPEPEIAKV